MYQYTIHVQNKFGIKLLEFSKKYNKQLTIHKLFVLYKALLSLKKSVLKITVKNK